MDAKIARIPNEMDATIIWGGHSLFSLDAKVKGFTVLQDNLLMEMLDLELK